MKLYARYDIGRLARLHLLDGRQHRSPQVCPRPGRGGANIVPETCKALFNDDRTMLGSMQERWLATGLRETRDRWNVIAQQTLMARADTKPGAHQYWTDAWDGYPPARRRFLQGLVDDQIRSTELTAKLRVVSSVKTPTSRVSTRATFAVRAGTPGARKIANQ